MAECKFIIYTRIPIVNTIMQSFVCIDNKFYVSEKERDSETTEFRTLGPFKGNYKSCD